MLVKLSAGDVVTTLEKDAAATLLQWHWLVIDDRDDNNKLYSSN